MKTPTSSTTETATPVETEVSPAPQGAAGNAGHSAVVAPDYKTDTRLDPEIRDFLTEFNKDPTPFWTLPQPQPQEALSKLQDKTPVDMSGVNTVERTISQNGQIVKLYIMSPTRVEGKPGIILFLHGGVWIVGNFHNHQRLLRDLVVGSGHVGVFVEYTPLPTAVYPTQINEAYAALQWIEAHADEFGADGSRIAVAGNSVGGEMTAALTLMAKDRNGPTISCQVLMIPAADASVDTPSYLEYGKDRFLTREFMKYGWDHYVSSTEMRDDPYVSPLRATIEQLRDLPPAVVITAENDPLRDEGEAYARKLEAAGVTVNAIRYSGTIHDFVLLNALRSLPTTKTAINLACESIKQHLSH